MRACPPERSTTRSHSGPPRPIPDANSLPSASHELSHGAQASTPAPAKPSCPAARARRGIAASHSRCLPHDPCRCPSPLLRGALHHMPILEPFLCSATEVAHRMTSCLVCSCMFSLRLLIFILQLVKGYSFPSILWTKETRATQATSRQLDAATMLTGKRLILTRSRFVLGRSRPLLSALSDNRQAHVGRPRSFSLLHFVRSMRNTCSNRTWKQRLIDLLRDFFCLLFWAGGWSIISRLGWDSSPRKSLICLLIGAAGAWMI
jgi:hypothetical protein